MNKIKRKLVLIFAAIFAPGILIREVQSNHQELYERFPDIPKKTVRSAYSLMVRDSLKDRIPGIEDMTDEDLDVVFLAYVQRFTKK